MSSSNTNGNLKWLAGGIAAAVILSVGASWTIASSFKADVVLQETQTREDIRAIREDVGENKESLARIEERLGITEE